MFSSRSRVIELGLRHDRRVIRWAHAGCKDDGGLAREVSQLMKAESIVAGALEQADPVAREAFLDQACAGDAALRRRVEALLLAHEQPSLSVRERTETLEPRP